MRVPPVAANARPVCQLPRAPLTPSIYGRRIAILASIVIGICASIPTVAFAAPTTAIAVTCDQHVSSQGSFVCFSQSQLPVAGTFAYDVTLTPDSLGSTGVDEAEISLRCPSAVMVGSSNPEVFGEISASGSENGSLGRLSPAGTVGLYTGNLFTYYSADIHTDGLQFFSIQGVWSNASTTACRFVVSAVIQPSAYYADRASLENTQQTVLGQINSFQTANHADLTSTLAISCGLCAKDATLSSASSLSHSDLAALLSGPLVVTCALCSKDATLSSASSLSHSDLAALLAGPLVITCALCSKDATLSTSNTSLASFQTATHSDMSTIIEFSGWIVGVILFLAISGILARTFWGTRDG